VDKMDRKELIGKNTIIEWGIIEGIEKVPGDDLNEKVDFVLICHNDLKKLGYYVLIKDGELKAIRKKTIFKEKIIS
jgi:hypothetical protein